MKLSHPAIGLMVALLAPGAASLAQPCTFTVRGSTWVLNRSCVTTQTVVIPDGVTLDGNGHRLTAMDPPSGSFTGAVVRNGGARAFVKNLRVEADGLVVACHVGEQRLRGISFEGASGSIIDSDVLAVNQGVSGCQEGNGIEVRNPAAGTPVRVRIERNAVGFYQKAGIVAVGNVDVVIRDNAVTGRGPVDFIAQIGIELAAGATGTVSGNQVMGNAYAGSDATGAGILVVGGAYYSAPLCLRVQIYDNELVDNDVGVQLSQLGADGRPPATPTRVRVMINNLSSHAVTNGVIYQAGISDAGNRDELLFNRIFGVGYDPSTVPGSTFRIDVSNALNPRVFGNR